MNDRQAAGFTEVRMRVGLGNAAVSSPTSMAKADIGRRHVDRCGRNLAGLFLDLDHAIDGDTDAPGIVAAIFEKLEGVEDLLAEICFLAHVTEDAAHEGVLRPGTSASRTRLRARRQSVSMMNACDVRQGKKCWHVDGCCLRVAARL